MRADPELDVQYARDKTVVVVSEKDLQVAENPLKRIWSEEVCQIARDVIELDSNTFYHHTHSFN